MNSSRLSWSLLLAGAVALVGLGVLFGRLTGSKPVPERETPPVRHAAGPSDRGIADSTESDGPTTPEAPGESAAGVVAGPGPVIPAGQAGREAEPAGRVAVRGKVTLGEGHVVAGSLTLVSREGRPYTATVSAGAYRLDGVPPGTYGVNFRPAGGEPKKVRVVEIPEGETEVVIDVKLQTILAVEGVVVDAASGKPLAGATVQFSRPDARIGVTRPGENRSARTDASGSFRITGLAAAPYDARVTRPDFLHLESRVDLGTGPAGTLRYELRRSSVTLSLQVLDARGRSATGRAVLGFQRPGEKRSYSVGVGLSDDGKPVSVRSNLEPGTYLIRVRLVRGSYGVAQTVTLAPGENGPFVLRLPADGR